MKTASGKKGQVLVLLAAVLAGLLAMAGLAIDAGMAYAVKAKLSAAVDAAALAAVRVAAEDETGAAARREASNFLNANFPDGLLGATVDKTAALAQYQPSDKSWTVTVSATASVPTYFAKLVGWSTLTVGAEATSTIRPVDLMLVIDCSSSLAPPVSDAGTMTDLKEAAKRFITLFNAKNDRIGLIHFATGTVCDMGLNAGRGFDKAKLVEKIDSIKADGWTTAEEALRQAQLELDAVPAEVRHSQRIIVFFTDGAPNGVAANYDAQSANVVGALSSRRGVEYVYDKDKQNVELKGSLPGGTFKIDYIPDSDWSNTVSIHSYNNIRQLTTSGGKVINETCNISKAARNMVENIANAARSEAGTPITIFTIGLGYRLSNLEEYTCGYGPSEFGENILKRVANVKGVDTYNANQVGGIYAYARDSSELTAAFNQVGRSILRLSK